MEAEHWYGQLVGDKYVDEREKQAQLIIDTAVERARQLGFGVVADGTVYGNGVWLDTLRVVRTDKPPER